jgi:hypothetical protein
VDLYGLERDKLSGRGAWNKELSAEVPGWVAEVQGGVRIWDADAGNFAGTFVIDSTREQAQARWMKRRRARGPCKSDAVRVCCGSDADWLMIRPKACLQCRTVKMRCAVEGAGAKCERCARKSLDCIFQEHRRGRKHGVRFVSSKPLGHAKHRHIDE